MSEIPELQDTGSVGLQQSGTVEIVPAADASPLAGLPIARTIEGLAATKSRSMGGEIGAQLLAGSFGQLSQDLEDAKKELRSTRTQLEQARQDLSDCRVKAAVLAERVETGFKGRHLRNFSISSGTVLVAIGIELYRSNFNKFALILSGFGGLLILLGWFSAGGRIE